jgi:hypothetical protein
MGILTLYDKVPTLLSRLHKSTQRLMDWLYDKIPVGEKYNVFGKW